MKQLKDYKRNLLTREEARKVLGGLRDVNAPTDECPDGTHKFTCYYGTNHTTYCVNNAIPDPDCNNPYPGWTPQPGVGVPA